MEGPRDRLKREQGLLGCRVIKGLRLAGLQRVLRLGGDDTSQKKKALM